jgi:hypothetical protein
MTKTLEELEQEELKIMRLIRERDVSLLYIEGELFGILHAIRWMQKKKKDLVSPSIRIKNLSGRK